MKTLKLSIALLVLTIVTVNSSFSQDWPNLEHFSKDNKAIGQATAEENRVVFMGNSITIGWIKTRPDFFKGKPYINRGISGQTTPQMLLRFRQDVIDLKPKVVVILAGTNDIAGNTGPSSLKMIVDNIKSMAELARSNGIKVIVSSVLPAFDYPWRPGLKPNEKIPALNSLLKEYTEANGHIYLDYFTAMADSRNGLPKKYAEDGVHPTAAGYAVMESMVEAAIKKALQ
ncbi:SGNH/GDSL hydrolase family protein [Arenibacter sp. M-2]|uniref:SGNH/GDSL hydrolase family protein n=1 Tax=unclassified Arenibacter TaxID=2615047 RepID=UPI000D75B557|nr:MULTISPECIES: SGNH/GDSL hydrolase family protein [unclassified Arenibacter]MDL5512778.1 SGNH/GDSL hydrolase family protein [Arenibacter sp. M-2]PXX24967.1 lysophospholipase L1-like esterase [Arenibacter sp. ARW7G5Y1]